VVVAADVPVVVLSIDLSEVDTVTPTVVDFVLEVASSVVFGGLTVTS